MIFTNDGCRQAVTKLFKKDRILLTITLVLIISVFPSAIRASSPQRVASLTLDGSSLGSCPSVTSSCSATINPQNANDLIMVFAIESLNQQASPCGFSVSDTANLAWTPRSSIVFEQTGKSEMQEFWAESISLLASETVTETITGCGNNYNTILVFAISGANLSHPFDPNTSLPGSANGNSGDTSVQVSTTNSNDILFAGLMHGSLTTPTTGPGFTFITTPAPDTSEYEVVSSPVTNMAVTFGDASPANWISIADAVQTGVPPPPPALTLSPSNGAIGTRVLVHGTGFQQSSSVQTTITFDDQLVGFVSIQNGAFNFTFNVPVAQPGPHAIKAVEQSLTANIIAMATSPFQVLPTPPNQFLTVSLSTGTIYFPGDNATIFVIVSLNGKRATISDLQLTLQVIAPSGSIKGLSTKAIQTGIFVSNFAVPAKNPKNSLGTYVVTVDAFSPTFGNASAATGFEVKPTWLATTVAPLTAGATLVTLTAVVGVAWQRGYFRKDRKGTPELSFE